MMGARNATPATYRAPRTPPVHIHHGFLLSPAGTLMRKDGRVTLSSTNSTSSPTTNEIRAAWVAEPNTPVRRPLTATCSPNSTPTASPTTYQMGDGGARFRWGFGRPARTANTAATTTMRAPVSRHGPAG